uniref:Uncharacterized protein n=1 Tax=Arundo donax TaxID=35708 RepID=A0A0A9AG54_ARUDO
MMTSFPLRTIDIMLKLLLAHCRRMRLFIWILLVSPRMF